MSQAKLLLDRERSPSEVSKSTMKRENSRILIRRKVLLSDSKIQRPDILKGSNPLRFFGFVVNPRKVQRDLNV